MEDFNFNTNVNLIPLIPNTMDEIPTIGGEGRCVGFEEVKGTNNLETFDFSQLFEEDD
jgi:hypothetical protein